MAPTNRLYSRKMEIYYQKNNEIAANLITHDHHLIKGSKIMTLYELTSTELYSILILKVQNKHSSNIYFENLFNHYDIDFISTYMLPRLVMHNNYMRSFQYKILNNILCLNKKRHTFGIKSSLPCSFCNLHDKTPFHIFCECDRVKYLWSDLFQSFQNT